MIARPKSCRLPYQWPRQPRTQWRCLMQPLSTGRPRIADIVRSPALPDSSISANITVHGFVRSVRKQKRVAFAAIGDGSSLESLQIVVSPQQAEKLSTGVAVAVTGKWTASPAGKQQANELHASEVIVLGANDATKYPIQKKYHTPEFLRTLPHLRPRTPYNALLLRLRSQTIADLTRFFSERGFVQTHTPIVTSSDCEGAGEVFSIESQFDRGPDAPEQGTLQLHSEPFFRQTKYLTVSSQLHLEALAQAVGNVWTLSPTFRAEKSDTARHLSEFYMLEVELPFVERHDEVMDLVEDMIRFLSLNLQQSKLGEELLSARSGAHEETDQGNHDKPLDARKLSYRWEKLLRKPWPRITYHEACQRLQNGVACGQVSFENSPDEVSGLQTEHEKYLAEEVGGGGPVFVTDYPRSVKPFYMAPSDPASTGVGPVPTVACFDLLMPDVCEVVGGSMREHRFEQLQEAMRQKGLAMSDFDADRVEGGQPDSSSLDWYLDLRRYGSVPHGGFGLGFDRLLGYFGGVPNIRDVVTFPRYYKKCLC